jgi:hypothetical protein
MGSDSILQLTTAVATGKDGRLSLEVSGVAPESACWLGVSFYLPKYSDPVWDADHAVHAVKPGSLKTSFPVPAGYERGTYEVGLWKDKLGENTFYNASGLRAYATGSVVNGPSAVDVADSVALLRTELTATDAGRTLTIKGEAQKPSCWLGVSFYKSGYTDAVLDGDYRMLLVAAAGGFTQTVTVPDGYEKGTYEVALWDSLKAKKRVFRLTTALGYGAGEVSK